MDPIGYQYPQNPMWVNNPAQAQSVNACKKACESSMNGVGQLQSMMTPIPLMPTQQQQQTPTPMGVYPINFGQQQSQSNCGLVQQCRQPPPPPVPGCKWVKKCTRSPTMIGIDEISTTLPSTFTYGRPTSPYWARPRRHWRRPVSPRYPRGSPINPRGSPIYPRGSPINTRYPRGSPNKWSPTTTRRTSWKPAP